MCILNEREKLLHISLVDFFFFSFIFLFFHYLCTLLAGLKGVNYKQTENGYSSLFIIISEYFLGCEGLHSFSSKFIYCSILRGIYDICCKESAQSVCLAQEQQLHFFKILKLKIHFQSYSFEKSTSLNIDMVAVKKIEFQI